MAKLSLLDADSLEPGQTGWAQLRLADPVAVARGDLFIVRIPSPSFTVGGGSVVDPHPKRHRRFQEELLWKLITLEQGSPEEIALGQLPPAAPLDLHTLALRTGLPQEQLRRAVSTLLTQGDVLLLEGARASSSDSPTLNSQSLVISGHAWSNLKERIEAMLASFHGEYPLRWGMPREEVRSRTGLDARAFSRVEARLIAEGIVVEEGPLMSRAGHRVVFTGGQQRRVDELLAFLGDAGVSPPSTPDLLARFGLDSEVLAALLDQGRLAQVTPEIVLEKRVYDAMVQTVVELIRSKGSITVATVRDHFNTSRKYALALLEQLDEKRVTRRVGDERVLF